MKTFACVVLLGSLMMVGCTSNQKVTPLPVGPMDEYRDPGYGFVVKYPHGWVLDTQVGRARFYSVDGSGVKFQDPTTTDAPDGAMISVEITKAANPAEEQKKQTDEMARIGVQLGKVEAITVAGKPATRVEYKAKYTSTSLITGAHVYIALDTLLYDINTAGFSTLYDANKAIFDSALARFTLPKPVEKGRDQTLPADVMASSDTKFFSFQYPDNFNFVNAAKGSNDLVLDLRGVRQDCSVRFDVFGAKGLTVEKVFDQNKGKYKATAEGKATVGGQPAMFLTYPATKDVERRFYFVVKNDKVIRITMDWFRPQREEYLAAYDRVLSSIKFK